MIKFILSIYLLFCGVFTYSQTFQVKKIVVDNTTKLPLENVSIFNETDNSTTNTDGEFIFVSKKNEINLNLLGYEGVKTTFGELNKTNDTLFMQLKTTQLNEVVVSNAGDYMKKVYDKMKDNYLKNYTVNFFLRNVLQKDNEIIVLQDINGKKNHNESQKKLLSLEFLNMRKTSFYVKKDHVSFRFPDFMELSSAIWPLLDKCSFSETTCNDDNYKKILFESNEKNNAGQIFNGYMIVNKTDYAIVEYSFEGINNVEIIPYEKSGLSGGKHRTIKYNKMLQFRKDVVSNKYFLSNAKLDATVEGLLDKNATKPFYFDLEINFLAINNPTNEKVIPNFATDKDIFKAKFPYSEDFWKNQNQLFLTKELKLFLKSVAEIKDKTKEYEVIGNF